MALIKCPKCENMLSDQATTCPNCGWTKPVHPHTTASTTTKDNAPDKKKDFETVDYRCNYPCSFSYSLYDARILRKKCL